MADNQCGDCAWYRPKYTGATKGNCNCTGKTAWTQNNACGSFKAPQEQANGKAKGDTHAWLVDNTRRG